MFKELWQLFFGGLKAPEEQPQQSQQPQDLRGLDFWEPRERMIFTYRRTAGGAVVCADPVLLYRKMAEVAPEIEVDMKLAASPHSAAAKGHDGAVEKICKLFDVQRLNEHGHGLTDPEILDLFNNFLDYCGEVKKNLSRYVTSSARPARQSPCSAPGPATSCSSGFGSTAAACSIGTPGPSPTASESPSASSSQGQTTSER